MPRTKQVKKKSSVALRQKRSTAIAPKETASNFSNVCDQRVIDLVSKEYESLEEFEEAFNIYSNEILQEELKEYQKTCDIIRKTVEDTIQKMPESIRNLKIHQYEDVEEDQNDDPNVLPAKVPQFKASSNSIESFEFRKPRIPKKVSSRASSRKRSLSASAAQTSQIECFKTPVMTRRTPTPSTITPKIYSDTPITMMRRPLHGEMAISMSGSPLMVGAVSREDIPTVNVPLQDGRVFSIMPEEGAAPPNLPEFDETTKNYLKTLRAHLEILAPNSP